MPPRSRHSRWPVRRTSASSDRYPQHPQGDELRSRQRLRRNAKLRRTALTRLIDDGRRHSTTAEQRQPLMPRHGFTAFLVVNTFFFFFF